MTLTAIDRYRRSATITEKEWSQTVVEAARLLGWRVYRTWSSLHSPAGFPDLTLLKSPRLIFAELKTEKGKPTAAQLEWLQELGEVSHVETYLWRPSDFDEMSRILQ